MLPVGRRQEKVEAANDEIWIDEVYVDFKVDLLQELIEPHVRGSEYVDQDGFDIIHTRGSGPS